MSSKTVEGGNTDGNPTKRQKIGDSGDTFLSPVNAFILKAGIEKMRLQIFENQLKKYGGTLSENLNPDVTHLIVDDKMDAERMCRLLKIQKPPENLEIVKSIWLSSCLKEKSFLDAVPYRLDCSVYRQKETSNTQTDSKPQAQMTDTGVVSTNSSDNERTLPKVGHMFGHKYKPVLNPEDDNDSDYNPSDGEGPEHVDTDSDKEKLVAVSPNKKLPVCFITI